MTTNQWGEDGVAMFRQAAEMVRAVAADDHPQALVGLVGPLVVELDARDQEPPARWLGGAGTAYALALFVVRLCGQLELPVGMAIGWLDACAAEGDAAAVDRLLDQLRREGAL